MRRFLLLLCAAASVDAQQDPMELLHRVQKKVGESLDRVPRYMCTQTVDRSQFEPATPARKASCDDPNRPAPHLKSSDRLRLDVAMGPHGEMYSWAGESKFDDADLFEIVREGALSTGSFAAFLTAIFRVEDVSFTYAGDASANGRVLSEFGFNIPYDRSHYSYGQGAHRVLTGYDGTFTVDAGTADLVHLEVRTARLPSETNACYASTTLDYSRVNMKGIDFLLPSASLLKIDRVDGGRAENRIVFSNCHEFLGESSISFGGEPHSAASEKASSRPPSFPPNLPFKIAIAQDLELTTAAAGDAVKAKLITPIRDGRKERAPAGSAVGARIMRIRDYYDESTVVFDLRLETVNVKSVAVPLTASADPIASFPKDGKLHRNVPLGTLRGLEDRSARFQFKGKNLVFLKTDGMESDWQTTKP